MTRTPVVARLAELAKLGAYDAGIDRGLFTAAEHEARRTFAAWARASGFALSQDRAGNLFARSEGRGERAPIVIGSHLDTVRTGGAYDGAYGVVGALCALELIAAAGIANEHPLEAVAWAGEEGSRFPMGCLGSGTYAGLNTLSEIDALVGDDGVGFADARKGPSGLLPGVPVRDGFPRPAACLELHIEQGPIMERADARLGVVTAIAGQGRYEVEIVGEPGHAGTVPMIVRHDAFSALAEIALALESRALVLGECVVTVGHVVVEPNQTNIVPGRVVFRVDARSVDDERVERLEAELRDECARVQMQRGVKTSIKPLERRRAVPMDERLRVSVRTAIDALGVRTMDVPSGAGHDTMCVATVAPAAMIFVPSAGGRSHVGEEYTSPEDLELGVEALMRSIVAVDRLLSEGT
jgi:hydantoinase/carbamoylase family amidase